MMFSCACERSHCAYNTHTNAVCLCACICHCVWCMVKRPHGLGAMARSFKITYNALFCCFDFVSDFILQNTAVLCNLLFSLPMHRVEHFGFVGLLWRPIVVCICGKKTNEATNNNHSTPQYIREERNATNEVTNNSFCSIIIIIRLKSRTQYTAHFNI